eukprot:CFRG0249T1
MMITFNLVDVTVVIQLDLTALLLTHIVSEYIIFVLVKMAGASHIPHHSRTYTALGKGMGAIMWTWVFYRAYHDGSALLGLSHPWEHHGHGDHHGEDKH